MQDKGKRVVDDMADQRPSLLARCLELASELSGAYRLQALLQGARVAPGVSTTSPSRIRWGRDVHVQRGSILHAGGKSWCGFAGYIRLADGVRIGPHCVLYGAGGIELEEHVHLGPGARLMSQAGRHTANRLSSRPDYNFAPIRIGAGSWIGTGAVVLGGASIGRCVTVAPNSVVSGTIPDNAVVVGNPGRVMFNNGKTGDGQ